MSTTLLRPTAVVQNDTIALGARVLVADGCVHAVTYEDVDADAVLEVDGTLLPGPIDLQVNGAGGRSVDEATPQALAVVARAVRAGGAAAFLPTLITAPFATLLEQLAALADALEGGGNVTGQNPPPAADQAVPLGIHLEGPFLEVAGAHDPACFVDPTPRRLDAVLAAARGKLRLVTLAPGRAGAPAAVARLRAAGVAVALGHARSTEGFAACVAAGARLVTHLWNAMGPLHHREPGIPGLALDEPRVCCSLILDGAHLHPAVVRMAWRCLGVERTVLITDAVAAAGMPDGEYQLQGNQVRLEHGVVRDRKGTLAGSALTMARAARTFCDTVAGAGPWTLARVTAANPARVLEDTARGAIAPGKRAEFGVLGRDRELAVLTVG